MLPRYTDYVVGLTSEMILHYPVIGFLEDVTHSKPHIDFRVLLFYHLPSPNNKMLPPIYIAICHRKNLYNFYSGF